MAVPAMAQVGPDDVPADLSGPVKAGRAADAESSAANPGEPAS
ncbi:hypothetical protein [Streptomyces cyaneus]|nr:hypothetical protein [Streptomyces cyaneus]